MTDYKPAEFTRDNPCSKVVRRLERWRDVPGYEGLYQVSSWGRVCSYPNTRGKGMTLLKQGRISTGYMNVVLSVYGVRKNVTVHRLVLLAFRGAPEQGLVSRHMDGIRHHSYLSNLRWGTQSQNLLDRASYGESGGIGEHHGNAKLTEQCVLDIRARAARGDDIGAIANSYGVTRENIYYIRSRKAWRHI